MNIQKRSKLSIVLRIIFPFLLAILLIVITIYAFIIPEINSMLFEQKKEKVKDLCRNTIQLAEQYQERYLNGEITEDDAKKRFAERVRAMRYGDDLKEYFWITDVDQVMIMHPFMPEIEGQSLSSYEDPNGKKIFVQISRLVEANGFGYINYIWQLKDNAVIMEEKVSYVHLFKPWNWVIGTGIYYSDIQKDTSEFTGNINSALSLIVVLIGFIVLYIFLKELKTESYRAKITGEKEELIQRLKQINNELDNARKKAEEANNSKDIFLANVSHDLRTPLNGIVGFSRLIQEDSSTKNNATLLEYISYIQKSGKYLLQMINDILDFSKATAKKITLDYSVFSLNSVILEVKNSLNFIAKGKNISLKFEACEKLSIKADEIRLKKVLYNLLSNAIKYSPPETTIVIRLYLGKEEIMIDVQDKGIGISEEDQIRIFNPFEQVNKVKTEGTGLGLAIAKEIAILHGGKITLKSKTDIGSTFTVHLPNNCIIKNPAQTLKNSNDCSLKNKRVYIVEDDIINQKFTQLFLKKHHMIPLVFSTGADFIEMAKQQTPDVVLMDIELPDISGTKLIQDFNANSSKSIPVIALTGHTSKEKRNEFLSAGFLEVCTKPIDGDLLLKKLNELLAFDKS